MEPIYIKTIPQSDIDKLILMVAWKLSIIIVINKNA